VSTFKKIPLNNSQILERLDDNLWFKRKEVLDQFHLNNHNATLKDRDHYVSEKYFHYVHDLKRNHDGFPEKIQSWSFQHNTIKPKKTQKSDALIQQEAYRRYSDFQHWFEGTYCMRSCALFAVYPPGGFISWHNNANAAAYNCIFTWSETGDGFFKWYDRKNKKFVTWKDEPGWQCRLGYFAGYDDDWDELVYHCAATDCWRMTISFTFDCSEESMMMQQWLVDDLMEEI
jgi:hypothetical protein